MVQYYRDMWAKWSEMLAPPSDLVGKCRETKTTKKNKTKKSPWRWDPIHQMAFDNVRQASLRELAQRILAMRENLNFHPKGLQNVRQLK